jgi:hypothetical protein
MKILSSLHYLLLAVVVTVIIALVYATVQQSYRTAANDPQIQIAEDLGNKLNDGKSLENIFQDDTIDIAKSLSPVIIFYDASGKPIRSTGFLDGQMCKLPAGLFDHAKKNGMHSVSWQPRKGVRMAVVIVHTNSPVVSYVAAARSLREVEVREYNLRIMVFIAWIVCMVLIAVSAGIYSYQK